MKTEALRLALQNPCMNKSRTPDCRFLQAPWLALCLAAITAASLSPAVALAAPASIEGFEELGTSANTIKSSAEKMLNRARIMQEGMTAQVQAIMDEVVKLKDAAVKD
jgi:hypothetical protein